MNVFHMLGTPIDLDNHRWDVDVMDKIDTAKRQCAYNDLSVMAYAILNKLYTTNRELKKQLERK